MDFRLRSLEDKIENIQSVEVLAALYSPTSVFTDEPLRGVAWIEVNFPVLYEGAFFVILGLGFQ